MLSCSSQQGGGGPGAVLANFLTTAASSMPGLAQFQGRRLFRQQGQHTQGQVIIFSRHPARMEPPVTHISHGCPFASHIYLAAANGGVLGQSPGILGSCCMLLGQC